MRIPDKIESGLKSPDLEVRKAFAEDLSFKLNASQIARGLNDNSPIIRYIFAVRCINGEYEDCLLSESQIKQGLKDGNESVRAVFMRNNEHFITSEYIDHFLKDDSTEVMIALARNNYINFTREQIKIGLSSPIKRVHNAFLKRLIDLNKTNQNKLDNNDVFLLNPNPSIASRFLMLEPELSFFEIERGFISPNANVRLSYVSYVTNSIYAHNFCTNYMQLDRGLNDGSAKIRKSWLTKAIRDGLSLTKKQIDSLLDDSYIDIRKEICFYTDDFTDEQIERGLTDKDKHVRESFIRANRTNLTEKQINRAIKDPSSYIRAKIVEHVPNLTEEQIEPLLSDTSLRVIFSIIGSDGLDLTEKHIAILLKNDNPLVVDTIKYRQKNSLHMKKASINAP